MTLHTTQFHTMDGDRTKARGVCTCGWVKFGTLAEVQAAAACHDMDGPPAGPVETPPFWTQAQP